MTAKRYSAWGLALLLTCAGGAALAGSTGPTDPGDDTSTPMGNMGNDSGSDPDITGTPNQDTRPGMDPRSSDQQDKMRSTPEDTQPHRKGPGEHDGGSKKDNHKGNY